MTNSLILAPPADPLLPTSLQDRTAIVEAFETFFACITTNLHTRRAYKEAAEDFLTFTFQHAGLHRLDSIKPLHVSAWMELMKARGLSVPTVKQRLAGLSSLFDFLASKGIAASNPAAVVKGPKHHISKGKTPVLSGDEMLQLLDAIDTKELIGLRDRAMIGTMAYSFARIGAVTALKVGDVFHQKRRLWLRLHEKGGKVQDIPCHHQLEAYIDEWLDAAGHRGEHTAFLFQTFARKGARKPEKHQEDSGEVGVSEDENSENLDKKLPKKLRPLSGKPMTQAMTWEMIQRRRKAAGLDTAICNHTFRATGITAYLANGGAIERAAIIAGDASVKTTQIYDRRSDDVTLDEIEKIRFA